ncbi:MAG: hypothetical protein HY548_06595, partial [Elusimicrobia bacterium]|nr:hypothetical protein [Elusimicrobiota bacterium]
PQVTLSHDGSELRLAPLLVAVANCKQYGSGAKIAPKAVVNDGFLHLVVVNRTPWYRLIRYLPNLFNGTLDQAPFLKTTLTKELHAEFDREIPYHIDGEIRFGGTKFSATIEPQALTLQVPREYRVS